MSAASRQARRDREAARAAGAGTLGARVAFHQANGMSREAAEAQAALEAPLGFAPGVAEIPLLEQMLDGAPADPGPIAEGLLGWTRGDALAVCSACAGRIIARGFGTAFRGWHAVFEPEEFPGCDLPSCAAGCQGGCSFWDCARPNRHRGPCQPEDR